MESDKLESYDLSAVAEEIVVAPLRQCIPNGIWMFTSTDGCCQAGQC